MVVVVVALLIAVVVVGVVLSRMTSQRKKDAVESLEAERKAIESQTILDIVAAEVADLGLRDIDGSADIPPGALLRGWSDADPTLHAEQRSHLRFVVRDGIGAEDAEIGDVRLERSDPATSDPTVDDAGGDETPTDGS